MEKSRHLNEKVAGMAGGFGKWVPSWLPLPGAKGVVTMVD
jgi:hypothetical protein